MVALLIVALATFAPAEAHAQYASGNALGGSFNFNYAGNSSLGGFAFTGKHESLPLMFTGSLSGGNQLFGVNLGADRWIINNSIGRLGYANVSWYWGIGAQASLHFGDGVYIGMGARMPIGLSWNLGNRNEFEIFTEAVLGINVLGLNIGSDFYVDLIGIHMGNDFSFTPGALFNFGVNAGLRYWL